MAEVIDYWPETRQRGDKRFRYPWDRWMELDENGHGDIWLAELGIDFPEDSNVWHFRSALYTRSQAVTRSRKKKAPLVLMRSKTTGKVVRMPKFKPIRVSVRIVSETQVAFQFFDSAEPPPEPKTIKTAVPTLHPQRRRSLVEKRKPTDHRNTEKVLVDR